MLLHFIPNYFSLILSSLPTLIICISVASSINANRTVGHLRNFFLSLTLQKATIFFAQKIVRENFISNTFQYSPYFALSLN